MTNSKVLRFKPKKGGDSRQTTALPLHPLQRRLNELGQSRSWLAKECGVSEQYIGQIINRRRPLNINSFFFIKLKKALQIDVDYLTGTNGKGRSA